MTRTWQKVSTLLIAASALVVGCGEVRPQANDGEELGDALSGTASVQAVHSGKCADVKDRSLAVGAAIQQWSCSGAVNQLWTLRSVGTNTFNLVASSSGLCMTVAGASTANAAGVVQASCGTGNEQRWNITAVSGGFRIQAVHSGKCLDVSGVSAANGALLQQWSCSGGANQVFRLNGATTTPPPPPTTPPTTQPPPPAAGVAALLNLTRTCTRVVSAHSYSLDNGQSTNICGLNGAIFWTADMDIDCDGRNVGDGKCPGPDPTYLPDTAFHNNSGQPLAASVTPYVVIPNDFRIAGLDSNNGGNVTAIIFNNKLTYAVFGDTGPTDIIGEASYAAAVSLGINPNPATGGTAGPVTYITFIGTGTRPSNIEDQAATKMLGDKLAAQLVQTN